VGVRDSMIILIACITTDTLPASLIACIFIDEASSGEHVSGIIVENSDSYHVQPVKGKKSCNKL
jgi:hypothetical protein